MSKTVYRFFSDAEFRRNGGKSYAAIICDDDYNPENPFTDVPIPDDLASAGKVPFFDPLAKTWTDRSDDEQILQIQQQKEDLASAKSDAVEAKSQVKELQAALNQANTDIGLSNQATAELTNLLFSVADQDKLAAAMGIGAESATQGVTQNA